MAEREQKLSERGPPITTSGMERHNDPDAWHIDALIELVRIRYPDWECFSHPQFVADEITPKRRLRERFRTQLGKEPLRKLLREQQYDQIIKLIEKIGRNSKLLYNRVPANGDLKLVYLDTLPQSEFCHQFNEAIHGNNRSEERLENWQRFLRHYALPEQWAFITLFMFLADPQHNMFVKAMLGRWLVKFAGQGDAWTKQPHPATLAEINHITTSLLDKLAAYGAKDFIDIQSFLSVAYRENRGQLKGLNPKARVELDQPPTVYQHKAPAPVVMHEDSAEYAALPDSNVMTYQPAFSLTDSANLTLRDEATIATWQRALDRKGQIILYGPPGTGKTFSAQALARHLVSETTGFVELIQLHPGYAYEDFVYGLRPVEHDGRLLFEGVPGRFLDFCQRAVERGPDNPCVLILDEINRADLARVFGELMYLLEYRDREIVLAGGRRFAIPANVRLIGTMNTADRSIALVDFALRRRFAFHAVTPNFDILRRYHLAISAETQPQIDRLIKLLQNLNSQIEAGYQLGCSYFLHPDLHSNLGDIWQSEIEPYLDEYFYGRPRGTATYTWESVRKTVGY